MIAMNAMVVSYSLFTAYLLGWLCAIPLAMKRRMLQELCFGCWRTEHYGHPTQCHYAYQNRYVPRGSLHERRGGDVAWALFAAAFWPTHLLWTILARLARLLGAGVTHAVNRAAPLTAPELERRCAEQAAEIERLTGYIDQQVSRGVEPQCPASFRLE